MRLPRCMLQLHSGNLLHDSLPHATQKCRRADEENEEAAVQKVRAQSPSSVRAAGFREQQRNEKKLHLICRHFGENIFVFALVALFHGAPNGGCVLRNDRNICSKATMQMHSSNATQVLAHRAVCRSLRRASEDSTFERRFLHQIRELHIKAKAVSTTRISAIKKNK